MRTGRLLGRGEHAKKTEKAVERESEEVVKSRKTQLMGLGGAQPGDRMISCLSWLSN